jgi:hypothetical protein
MYVTLKMIYSWPMDSAYLDSEDNYVKVSKEPPNNVLTYRRQVWHSSTQKILMETYRLAFIIVFGIIALIWVFIPLYNALHKLLFKVVYPPMEDADSEKGYSSLKSVMTYVPLLNINKEKFICAYMEGMQPENRPVLVRSTPEDKDDLTSYVPIEYQRKVLSIVKYYENKDKQRRPPTQNIDQDLIKFIINMPSAPETDSKVAIRQSINSSSSQRPPSLDGNEHIDYTRNSSIAPTPTFANTADLSGKFSFWDNSVLRRSLSQNKREDGEEKDDLEKAELIAGLRTSMLLNSAGSTKTNAVVPDGVAARPNRKVQKKQFMQVSNKDASSMSISQDMARLYGSGSNSNSIDSVDREKQTFSNKNSYRIVLKPINRVEPASF